MKRIKILFLIISMVLLASCFSYNDMNRVYFATMSILDETRDGKVVLYEEFFTSDGGTLNKAAWLQGLYSKQKEKHITMPIQTCKVQQHIQSSMMLKELLV